RSSARCARGQSRESRCGHLSTKKSGNLSGGPFKFPISFSLGAKLSALPHAHFPKEKPTAIRTNRMTLGFRNRTLVTKTEQSYENWNLIAPSSQRLSIV